MLYVTVCYVCCLSLCDATDAAVSGTLEIPPCFSRLVRLVWTAIYYSIYPEIFVGTRTYKCCVALPVLNVRFLCVRLFVSLCFSCDFTLCFLTCQTVAGRHNVSHLLYCGFFELWEAGFCTGPASPTFPQSGLPCEVGDSEIYDEGQIMMKD